MRFEQFVDKAQSLGIFESSLVLPFFTSRQQAQRQLVDWMRTGKILQLRRGLYAFSPHYSVKRPALYEIANRLVRPSYVSLQSALSHYGMIPEHVAVVTSVTTGRPQKLNNAFGRFFYRHIKASLFFGFAYRLVSKADYAYVATPEKALLDLIYLTPNADSEAYLWELRLQNLEVINIERLQRFVDQADQPKLRRALPHLLAIIREEVETYESL